MTWDLGASGLGLLIAMALAFAVTVQLLAGRGTGTRLAVLGGLTYLVAGVLVSEGWFGWATGAELQPNIDGLSVDEVLLFATIAATVVVAATWWVIRGRRARLAA
jgi:hypothetical protein